MSFMDGECLSLPSSFCSRLTIGGNYEGAPAENRLGKNEAVAAQ
jgi:hypothetical protein